MSPTCYSRWVVFVWVSPTEGYFVWVSPTERYFCFEAHPPSPSILLFLSFFSFFGFCFPIQVSWCEFQGSFVSEVCSIFLPSENCQMCLTSKYVVKPVKETRETVTASQKRPVERWHSLMSLTQLHVLGWSRRYQKTGMSLVWGYANLWSTSRLSFGLLAMLQGACSAERNLQKMDGETIAWRHILSNPRWRTWSTFSHHSRC